MNKFLHVDDSMQVNELFSSAYALIRTQPELAIDKAKEILTIYPDSADACEIIAQALAEQDDFQAALAWQHKVLFYKPEVAPHHYNFAVYLSCAGDEELAMIHYLATLRIDPDFKDALWNASEFYRLRHNDKAALPMLQRIIDLGDYYDSIYHRMAVCYHGLGDVANADKYFMMALEKCSDVEHAHCAWYCYSHLLLSVGNFKRGWEAHDSRYQHSLTGHGVIHDYPYDLWQGQTLLGKTLLIHGEQGLGDQIMFASIIPALVEEGANIILAIDPSLCRLFTNSFSSARVVAHQAGVEPASMDGFEPIDYHIPICSLARYRGPQSPELPILWCPTQNYLAVNEQRKSYFEKRIEALRGTKKTQRLRVGLMWNANPSVDLPGVLFAKRGKDKSLPIAQLKSLSDLAGDIDFVSLQNHVSAKDIIYAPELQVIDMHDELYDFCDTAALASCMDLIISVDTSVAHLAGGLGVKNWILLKKNADWRWLNEGESSYWYRSSKLFRQREAGDWTPVVEQIYQELKLLVS